MDQNVRQLEKRLEEELEKIHVQIDAFSNLVRLALLLIQSAYVLFGSFWIFLASVLVLQASLSQPCVLVPCLGMFLVPVR